MYNKFKEHSPIAGDVGQPFVEASEKSLQALRDIILFGDTPGWTFISGAAFGFGTWEQPALFAWISTIDGNLIEQIDSVFTWGTYGPTAITWNYTIASVVKLIGVETITYDASGNCTGSTWSGTAQIPLFVDGKPITATDSALKTIDYVRENLMAIRDDVAVGLGTSFNYSPNVGTGTAQEPEELIWKKGAYWIKGTPVYLNGLVTSILWEYSSNTGSSFTTIGTETFSHDASQNCTAITWSGTSGYTNFENNVPVLAEANANNIIVDIKNNLQALRDGAVFQGVYGWNYSISGGTNEQPAEIFYKNGTNWIRIKKTYGVSGAELNCVTKEVIDYSENSGTDYDSVGTINYTYIAAGIVAVSAWA